MLLASRARRSPRGRRRASRSSPRWRTGSVPYELVARCADVGFVTPRDAADAAQIVGADPGRAGRGRARGRRPCTSSATWSSSSTTTTPTAARPPRRGWTSAAGAEYTSDAPSSPARRPSWPTCCRSGREAGLTGFRLRPGGPAARPAPRSPAALVPELQRRGLFRTALRGGHAARRCSGLPRPANRYASRLSRTGRADHEQAKQIHLAAHFPGVNNTTVWSDPAAGSHIEFDSFVQFAQTAERGKFDFLFLAEGLRLREQNGADLRPRRRRPARTPSPCSPRWPPSPSASGLTGTINSTFNEPYEVARQFASPRPPVRRPGGVERRHLLGRVHRRELPPRRLPGPGPALRAGPGRSCATAHELLDSWRGDEIVADPAPASFLRRPGAGHVRAPRTRTSTSPASSTCRAARRAAR